MMLVAGFNYSRWLVLEFLYSFSAVSQAKPLVESHYYNCGEMSGDPCWRDPCTSLLYSKPVDIHNFNFVTRLRSLCIRISHGETVVCY